MLSLARSRYTLSAQLVFSVGNGLGVFLGVIYNGKTPDLYPNNSHHKIGWIITVVFGAHVFLCLLDRVTGFMKKDNAGKGAYCSLRPYAPGSTDRGRSSEPAQPAYRASYDSGHGTDRLTESLRSNSVSTLAENSPLRSEEGERGFDEEVAFTDVEFLPRESRPSRWNGWVSRIPMGIFRRGSRVFSLYYHIIDRVILLFGFVAFTTGIATFGRFFVRQQDITKSTVAGGHCANRQCRRARRSSVDWHIGSRAAYSSGSASSLWAGGRAPSATSDGYVISSTSESCSRLTRGAGLECPPQEARPEVAALVGIRRERPDLLLWIDQHLPRASRRVGRRMVCPRPRAHLHHRPFYRRWPRE